MMTVANFIDGTSPPAVNGRSSPPVGSATGHVNCQATQARHGRHRPCLPATQAAFHDWPRSKPAERTAVAKPIASASQASREQLVELDDEAPDERYKRRVPAAPGPD